MMRLVNSYLSKQPLTEQEISTITHLFTKHYEEEIEINSYKYDHRIHYETDFDLVGIEFQVHTIHSELDKLITIHEQAMLLLDQPVEVIVANDDTDTEIHLLEKDPNNVSGFGLFITQRSIPTIKPYYASQNCYAYVSFEFVSFGVLF
ncbi:hypothetical protein [Rossellomorea marisflavi]|nr:hypothetical protein [Rossellomorea marisflavi]